MSKDPYEDQQSDARMLAEDAMSHAKTAFKCLTSRDSAYSMQWATIAQAEALASIAMHLAFPKQP